MEFEEWKKQLPQTALEEKKLKLAEQYGHEMDEYLFFDEGPHKYYLFDPVSKRGVTNLTSVTTLIGQYHQHFDADAIIAKNLPKWTSDKSSKYHGLTPQEIKTTWNNGNKLGTYVHRQIELFYNDALEESESHGTKEQQTSPEFQYFLKWHQDYVLANNWMVYRTEWRIFSVLHRIAGTIDCIIIPNTDRITEIIIYDWKRSKGIDMHNPFQKMYPPLGHLDDCNFNHYAIQLNIYKYLLEKYYNFKVIGMFLGVFHPNHDGFQTHEMPVLHEEIERILAERLVRLNYGLA